MPFFRSPLRIALGSASGVLVLLAAACSSDPSSGSGDLTADGGLLGGDAAVGTDGSAASKDGGAAATGSTLGGSVAGYAGTSLVLESNGESLPVAQGATSFAFPTKRASGTAYDVKVKAQPTTPSQTCTVAGGTGTMGAADVRSVAVTCVTNTYAVEVTVAGLKGTLVLTNNGGDDLSVQPPDGGSAKGTFATKVASGAAYAVAIKTQPANQVCTLMAGSGTVVAGTVTVTANCVTNKYAVGGTVSGLDGAGLVLQNSAGDDLAVNANGAFAFATPVEAGAPYAVTVKTQPTSKWQTCTVTNGTGTVGGAPVGDVAVACTTNAYKLSANVTGLPDGTQVELGNGGESIVVTTNTTMQFPTLVASGAAYDVQVVTAPAGQTCTVTNGVDTMKGADVVVGVACEATKYKVGGEVTGLPGGESVVLQNNAGDDLMLNANGAFAFATRSLPGAAYAVTVKTQPASKTCYVKDATGTVGNGDVTDVSVACVGAAPVGSFTVMSGPAWGPNPPTYTCLEACAAQFGGAPTAYACSTSASAVDFKAWLDGWGTMQYCGATPGDEDFKKSATYNCGGTACSFSAWVMDHSCGKTNYCFAR